MVWIILLGSFFLITFTILCAQLAVTLTFERVQQNKSLSIAAHWLHPLVLRAAFDTKTNEPEVWLFGKIRLNPVASREGIGPTTYEAPSVTTPPHSRNVDNKDSTAEKKTFDDTAYSPPAEKSRPEEGSASAAAASETEPAGRVPLGKRARSFVAKIKKSAWMKALIFFSQTSWRSKIIRWSGRCLISLPRLVSFHSAMVHVRAGLPDPALTGNVFGFWTGVHSALFPQKNDRFALTIDPVFTENCFFIKGDVCIRSSLMRFAVLFALAAVTFPYFSTIKAWRRASRQ
jgi:hypothetical protein